MVFSVQSEELKAKLIIIVDTFELGSNASTTPITAMGYRQCLTLGVVQLKDKHGRKPHCGNGVVDMFEPTLICCLLNKLVFPAIDFSISNEMHVKFNLEVLLISKDQLRKH